MFCKGVLRAGKHVFKAFVTVNSISGIGHFQQVLNFVQEITNSEGSRIAISQNSTGGGKLAHQL